MLRIIVLLLFFSNTLICSLSVKGNGILKSKAEQWADSVLSSLTDDEKIGQLFMIAAYSNKGTTHKDDISELISKYGIGGIIFFQGGPVRQALLTNHFQSVSTIPLFIGIDGEWGLAMRLDSTLHFPYQMTLGSIREDSLIYEMGKRIAHQFKRMGIHINFAPVMDINNNPDNPVIGFRSFGENKEQVSKKSILYFKGMQDGGIMAVGKHFPGHGDTDKDSHLDLPVVLHDKKRLKNMELFPFEEAIIKGLDAVMVAHIHVPAFDKTENQPATLSFPVINNLLKEKMDFKGLIFTDALNMKGVTKYFKPGDIEVKAILAGNDILLFPENVETAFYSIKKAISEGILSMETIQERSKKVLVKKYKMGLYKKDTIEIKNLIRDLNSKQDKLFIQKLYENSLILLNSHKNIPYKMLDTLEFATLAIGSLIENKFQKMISNYAKCDHYNISNQPDTEYLKQLVLKLSKYDQVIISVHSMTKYPYDGFGITPQSKAIISSIKETTNLSLIIFGNPYSLKYFGNSFPVLVANEDNDITQRAAAQALLGGLEVSGMLPVSPSKEYKFGNGEIIKNRIRLKYTSPEELDFDSSELSRIDSITLKAINAGAMPGCQILFAKDGKVFYHKSFGYHTYDKNIPVTNPSIYDLASVTKVATTVPVLMQLYDMGQLDLNLELSQYLPDLDGSNKRKLKIRDILVHQAGLQAWIPFWNETVNKDGSYKEMYSSIQTSEFNTRVAENLFIRNGYDKVIIQTIIDSKVKKWHKEYLYSDLGFYLFQKIIEDMIRTDMETYVIETFYKPLGMQTMGYLPRERFPIEKIVPTENDKLFRKQLIHGDVHDPGAAMLGGVAGHAGLFSNSNDLAIFMQMLLNEGEYGGERFFIEGTVKEFTKQQFLNNRRGLGFDKPETDPLLNGPTCKDVSTEAFGHSGFTGTCVWADPKYNLIYIFLSNRVHPDASNNKLVNMNVRTEIQQVVYDLMKKKPVSIE